MEIKVAINGLGRIGRTFFKEAIKRPEINIVAVNDLGNPQNLVYLMKYDTAYGKSDINIGVREQNGKPVIAVDDTKIIKFLSERDPALLPWGELEVDIVVEATGFFASFQKSQAHLKAGAKRVVISAPVKDEPVGINGATVLMGVNESTLSSCDISSNASCTTNAGSPIIAILSEAIGIEKAILNTIHGYTSTQSLVDNINSKDFRRGRAAAQNIIPATTGAAIAITQVLPHLKGLFDGIAMRVPVITGSIVDITFISKKDVTVEEVNALLKEAASESRWKKVFSVTEEPIVSSDIIGAQFASIADLSFTRVVDGNLVKVLAWYDNEMGYVSSLLEHVVKSGKYLLDENSQ